MTQDDDIVVNDRIGGTVFLRLARLMIMACGLMIGLVVLSDPRVTGAARDALAQMQPEAGEDIVARQDTGSAFPALTEAAPPEAVTDAAATQEEAARPRVSILPESRVNVIRLTD